MRLTRKHLAVVTAVGASGLLTGAMVLHTSGAAFTASTSVAANRFTSATVTLTGSLPAATALFDTATQGTFDGGQVLSRCITVSLASTLQSANTRDVRLYLANIVTTAATDLSPYLGLTVETADLATGTTVSADCLTTSGPAATFTSLSGVTDTLKSAAYTGYGTGLGGWATAKSGDRKVYKITTTVADDNLAQGRTAQADFVWEAR